MARYKITLQEINVLDENAFTHTLAGLFEGPAWIVAQAWSSRPFSSTKQLYQTLCSIMYQSSMEQQVDLLNAHPDLVGRAALTGTLSPASTNEQAAAGLDHLTATEITTFQRFNQTYRDQFGFPFVICARENKKASILDGFVVRLQHTRQQEIEIALGEVAKICALRLHDLIDETSISQVGTENV
jgi:OHCU decarboxylase